MNPPKRLTFATLVLLAVVAPVLAADIPATSDWFVLSKSPGTAEFDIYRRYGFLNDPAQPFPNVLLLNCARTDTYFTHVTFEIPKSVVLKSFARDSWFPKLTARFMIDGDVSLSMEGEYHDGEFFFDDSPSQHDAFQRVLAAHHLAIGFGDKNDEIGLDFRDAMNDAMDNVFKQAGTDTTGTVARYDPTAAYKLCKI